MEKITFQVELMLRKKEKIIKKIAAAVSVTNKYNCKNVLGLFSNSYVKQKQLNFFFLSGFSFTNIHESQDCRGKGRAFL